MCRKLRHKKNLAQDSRPVIVEQILNKTIDFHRKPNESEMNELLVRG